MSKEIREQIDKFKNWEQILKESVTDKPSKNLSDIFNTSGKISEDVKSTITNGIEIIKKNFPNLQIIDYFVVGAAVTFQYSEDSDIDTTVTVTKSTNKELLNKVDKWVESNLDNKFYHNKRPYQFKVNYKTREDLESVDAAYDIQNDQWIKKPDYEKSVQMYNDKILNKNSNENKLYNNMENFVRPSLEKLYNSLEIGRDIRNSIINAYNKYGEYSKLDSNINPHKKEGFIKKLRSSSYEREIEPNYVSQNWGKGNVIYKMFDDEKYIEVYHLLKEILKSNNMDEIKLDELKIKLEKVIKDEIGYKP